MKDIIRIKQATKLGYAEMEVGGVADLNYPDSKTRRGRVEELGNISPTIAAEAQELFRIERSEMERKLRIRKLTERECWRLQDFSDEDYEKAASVVSATQRYKQAGNSIVRVVLMSIFSQMGIQDIPRWNDLTLEQKRALRNINKSVEQCTDDVTQTEDEPIEEENRMTVDEAIKVIVANRIFFKGEVAEALDTLVMELANRANRKE